MMFQPGCISRATHFVCVYVCVCVCICVCLCVINSFINVLQFLSAKLSCNWVEKITNYIIKCHFRYILRYVLEPIL